MRSAICLGCVGNGCFFCHGTGKSHTVGEWAHNHAPRKAGTMSERAIWSGEGRLEDGAAYFTLNNGELKGRRYVRQRAVQALALWKRQGFDTNAVLRDTVDNDAWLERHSHELVGSVCRAVVSAMLDGILEYRA